MPAGTHMAVRLTHEAEANNNPRTEAHEGSLFFGLYYGFTAYYIGYTTGLRAFTSAVLGGIGSIPGAVLGGLCIGLTQSLGGQLLGVKWTDVIIFSILITVMVFRPNGLLGAETSRRA